MNTQTLITKRELSERLDVTIHFINQLTKAGKIPCFEMGPNSHVYDLDAVLKALAKPVKGGK